RTATLRSSPGGAGMAGVGGFIDIKAFLLARPVRHALRRAEGLSRPLARNGDAPEHLIAVRRIDRLVVGAIKRLLVHVAPDERPFFPLPLGGRGRGGGSAVLRMRRGHRFSSRPPSLPSPQGGEGSDGEKGDYPKFSSWKKSLPLSSMTM